MWVQGRASQRAEKSSEPGTPRGANAGTIPEPDDHERQEAPDLSASTRTCRSTETCGRSSGGSSQQEAGRRHTATVTQENGEPRRRATTEAPTTACRHGASRSDTGSTNAWDAASEERRCGAIGGHRGRVRRGRGATPNGLRRDPRPHSAPLGEIGLQPVPHQQRGARGLRRAHDRTGDRGAGAALLRRGVFALFMGLFARGCVSPVLISGGQQPSQRVPASFRRPAEPRNGAEHRRSVPLRRAPFWTFARRSGTVPWEGRQTCDGCDDRIPGTYIRRAPNLRPLHRSPEASPVRSGRCCLRGCQSLPLVQRSPADERERTRTGTAPAGPGVGAQAPARTSRPTQPERGCWSGRGHQRCRVLGAARARKPRRNDLRHDAGCGSGLRAARSRRLASARCRAEPAAGALLGRDAPPRDHRDRLAGTTAYALEATVVLDIIHVAAATRRAVLVAGSSKGLSAFGPRPDGSRPARGDTGLQLRMSSAAAGSRSLDAY